MKHLLVTNDFPPKVGGIQSYLWELWRRLPADDVTVLTLDHPGARDFDAVQGYRVERVDQRMLLPTPANAARIERLAAEVGAEAVVLDPALPIGLVGPRLSLPYGVVVHGAEITVPGRVPGTSSLLGWVLRRATHVIAAGGYPAAEAEHAAGRPLPVTIVPPGVDPSTFRVLGPEARAAARRRFELPAKAPVVVSVSRLVPRKGMDVLIRAAAHVAREHPDLVVAVGGAGRDRPRLERLAGRLGAPVRFLGRVPDGALADLYGCADVFAMLCRNRWGGLEQEGFGVVFLEAAAAGLPAVAGRSGGAHEAVVHGETGYVVDHPRDDVAVARALLRLIDEPDLARRMGSAARRRVEHELSYDRLASRLGEALQHLR